MATQSEDFKWFTENLGNLYKQYPDKYIIIQDKKVLASADTLELGVDKILDMGLEFGTFIMQLCGKDESCYTAKYFSRDIFS